MKGSLTQAGDCRQDVFHNKGIGSVVSGKWRFFFYTKRDDGFNGVELANTWRVLCLNVDEVLGNNA